jgi:hypothetical protein
VPPEAGGEPAEIDIGGLTAATADLELGNIWESATFSYLLALHNRQPTAVKATDFETSCGCTAVSPRSLSIEAGQTATVRLAIDLTHRAPAEVGRAVRPFQVAVRPLGPSLPIRGPSWQLNGVVNSRVTLDALALHFGETVVEEQPLPTRNVNATLHVPSGKITATVDPPQTASVRVVPDSAEPARFALNVTPGENLPSGPFHAVVSVTVRDSEGREWLGATLPVAGAVQPAVRPLPARLLLGAHPLGATAEATVVLQVPAGVEWTVDHIETDEAAMQVDPVAVEGVPRGRAYRLRLTVAKAGDQRTAVRFVVRKPGRAVTPVTTEVVYLGEPAVRPTDKREGEKP